MGVFDRFPKPIDVDAAPPRAVVRAGLAMRRRLHAAADALLPPQMLAYEETTAFFRTRVAGALVELGVIDRLAERPARSDELATELGLDAETLHRVLRFAAAQRLVDLRGGRFSLARKGRGLASAAEPTVSFWARHVNTPAVQDPWANLAESIRTGEPCFPAVMGKSIWSHFAEHPEEERLFASSMREMSALVAPWIVAGYPWPEHGTVCDIAGGSGPVLAAVLSSRPQLRGKLVEAPGVLPEAERHLGRAGVRDRVDLVDGNIFEGIEAEGDLYLLKDIVHDWDDASSIKILETVAAAMPAGAKLLMIETLIDADDTDPIATSVDVQMHAVCDGGKQRSAAELQALAGAAGLRAGQVHLTGGPALVEAIR